jgi:DNA-binding protein
MTYVNATLTLLSNEPTVTAKARGRNITIAVDVSQMIVKRMNAVGYRVSSVRIFSEKMTSLDGKERNVSVMEVDVTRT